MKQFIIVAATLISSIRLMAAEPTQKVLDAFHRTFQVQNVIWQEFKNKQYEANFSQNDVKVRVVYDAEGNMIQSIRYYSACTLPILIQEKISRKYKGMKIFGITEVTQNDSVEYHIVLEDAREFVHVKSDASGSMEITQRFHKA